MSGDWFTEKRQGVVLEVAAFFTPTVVDPVVALLELGCLVSLSTSRDGGAFSCTVTYNGQWKREWFRGEDALAEWLLQAVDAVRGMASAPAPNGTVRRLNGPQRGQGSRWSH